MNIALSPEFSDGEIENDHTAWMFIEVSRGCTVRVTCKP